MVMFPTPATGSLVADLSIQGVPDQSAAAGGSGLAESLAATSYRRLAP